MRILLTGASGFIGQALTAGLDHDIIPLHLISKRGGVHGDLRVRSDMDRAVKQSRPDAVIHLAAKTEVAWSFDDYSDVSTVNYVGTVHLAEAVARYAPDAHLIFASTMETYGRQETWEPFTEETPQNPCAPYAVAKVAAEKYISYLEQTAGLQATILRQTNTYGRTDNDFFVVERIITQMLAGQKIRLGNPDPIRNFLHISDLVELYRTVLSSDLRGETFVTGPDNPYTIRNLALLIADLVDWDGNIEWNTQPPRPGEVFYLNSRPDKARELLGWEPKVNIVDGLTRTISAWS